MNLSEQIKKSISNSVLCWLATVSSNNTPNVSPKEIFNHYDNKIIIANIASPQSVKNISENKNVCLSFIDILVQKGFQLKGNAKIINKDGKNFNEYHACLSKMTQGKFPFSTIIEISVLSSKPIIAPKYILYPQTTEQEQIEAAIKTYGF